MTDTRDQILDVAERHFAEHGIGATSLRGIMTEAGVNPAAIHYHFGGKAALVRAVIDRRIGPVNGERAERFDALEAEYPDSPPPLARVIEAFTAPALLLSRTPERGGEQFMRLMGRFYYESADEARDVLRESFGAIVERFASLLRRAAPGLDTTTVAWRIHFMIGAMSHTMACRELVRWIEPDVDDVDVETIVGQLVAFCAAGLRSEGADA